MEIESRTHHAPNWDLILSSNLHDDDIFQNKRLFDSIRDTQLVENDINNTPENLMHLFSLLQFSYELKNTELLDSQSQVRAVESTLEAQEDEMRRLQIMSGGADSSGVAEEIKTLENMTRDLEARNESLMQDLAERDEELEGEKKRSKTLTEVFNDNCSLLSLRKREIQSWKMVKLE